ncbi:MAG: hypothetical protein ND866_12075, partial [Pyrinomonadaceae bacterium]|nr:hypothetical protein [Pyrinomonadaceae bacterium]
MRDRLDKLTSHSNGGRYATIRIRAGDPDWIATRVRLAHRRLVTGSTRVRGTSAARRSMNSSG